MATPLLLVAKRCTQCLIAICANHVVVNVYWQKQKPISISYDFIGKSAFVFSVKLFLSFSKHWFISLFKCTVYNSTSKSTLRVVSLNFSYRTLRTIYFCHSIGRDKHLHLLLPSSYFSFSFIKQILHM